MLYRTFDEIIQAAILTARLRIKSLSEKNIRKRMYNEKIKRRVKK